LAYKQVPYFAVDGKLMEPTTPNAIKFERFIFDLLPLAENAIVVEVEPSEGFAPLKNASGAPKDTPETTRAAMSAQHARWLRAAGAIVPDKLDVEINPSFAFDVLDLKNKIEPGLEITQETYFD
jgi:UDP-N-acetylglucosamine/UDP-N-acetylgalactosamine diphosphorylase